MRVPHASIFPPTSTISASSDSEISAVPPTLIRLQETDRALTRPPTSTYSAFMVLPTLIALETSRIVWTVRLPVTESFPPRLDGQALALEVAVDRGGPGEASLAGDYDEVPFRGAYRRTMPDLQPALDAAEPFGASVADVDVWHRHHSALRAFLAARYPRMVRAATTATRYSRSPSKVESWLSVSVPLTIRSLAASFVVEIGLTWAIALSQAGNGSGREEGVAHEYQGQGEEVDYGDQ